MPVEPFAKRYYVLPKAQIGPLRFVLESYDGLAFMRTIDASTGLVEVAWSVSRSEDVEALLAALADELQMVVVATPETVPPL